MQPHAGQALACAHFLDEAWAQRPARRIEASPWYEAAAALAQRLLLQATRCAPQVCTKGENRAPGLHKRGLTERTK